MELKISIEIGGKEVAVGSIVGNDVSNARFCYSESYISNPDNIPVSHSLQFQTLPFTPEQTRNYFEGLLPEGYTRKTVANWLHADEKNYLQILAALATVLFLWFLTEPMLEKLDRIKVKYGLMEAEEHEKPAAG